MKDALGEVVRQVRSSAEAVVTASSQVAAGTTDLSQRTEEQASSLEQTAASMEELSSTVRQNADNAREADDLARTATKRAEQGGAEEIKDLIGHSVDQVGAGAQLVERAGDTIQALVVDVRRVSGLMGSIAEASAEQSRGVQQVNKTVTEMDKVVQQNASAVQESAAAAEGMRQQAESLVTAVSAFRVAATARSRQPRPSVGARRDPALEFPPQAAAFPPHRHAAAALSAGGGEWEEV